MLLILELIGQRAGSLGRNSRRVFQTEGGTIGRSADCTWVLPEAWVSALHARIDFADGVFSITDTSSNGVGLPDLGLELQVGQSRAIVNGDRFEIGEYRIQATLLDADGLPIMPVAS